MAIRGDFFRWVGPACACAILAIVATGCGETKSADKALNDRLAESNSARVQIGAFAGTVTIDHEAPAMKPDESFMIMLYDPKNPPAPQHIPMSARVSRDGHFEFTTYTRGDGAPVGNYKVLFAAFKFSTLRGGSLSHDLLKNLYNDPDTSQFNVEITPSGKKDWNFDLEITGKEPNASPGPKAITRLVKN
jgi:hypothetical protein